MTRSPVPDPERRHAQQARSERLAALSAPRDEAAERRRLLDENARRAASRSRHVVEAAPIAEPLEVVVVVLGGERWAIETALVRSVERCGALTPLPGTPPVLAGIAMSRGRVLAVFSLAAVVGAPASAAPVAGQRLLVLGEDDASLFALLVDAVEEVATIDLAALAAPVERGQVALRGLSAAGVAVLDGRALLADPRLTIDQAPHRLATDTGTPTP